MLVVDSSWMDIIKGSHGFSVAGENAAAAATVHQRYRRETKKKNFMNKKVKNKNKNL